MSEKNILIVAQEPIIPEDVAMTLDQRCYKIIATVSSVEEAIEICRENRPDLVLMDLKGFTDQPMVTTARFIREEFGIPVAYLTRDRNDSSSTSKDLNPCVSRPFSEEEFCALVEKALSEDRRHPK